MERLRREIDEYNKFRKEELIPTIVALTREAMELGYEFEVGIKDKSYHFKTFFISSEGITYEYIRDTTKKTMNIESFAEEVSFNEKNIKNFYIALFHTRKGKPELTGKYIFAKGAEEVKNIYKKIREAGIIIDGFVADYVSPDIGIGAVVKIERVSHKIPNIRDRVIMSRIFTVQEAQSDKIDTIESKLYLPLKMTDVDMGINVTPRGKIEQERGSILIDTSEKTYKHENITGKRRLKKIRKIMEEYGYKECENK